MRDVRGKVIGLLNAYDITRNAYGPVKSTRVEINDRIDLVSENFEN